MKIDKSEVARFDHYCAECEHHDKPADSKECTACLLYSENAKKIKAVAAKIKDDILEALLS